MPVRVSDLKRAVAPDGVKLEPGKGSHLKFRRPGFRVYPVPAHNGERSELDDKYVKGLCRCLGLDEDEIRGRL